MKAFRTAVVTLLALTLSARAQAQVEMQLEVAASTVEVGQGFELTLSANSTGEAPSNVKLTAPPGVQVQGPSVGTSIGVSMSGRGITRTTGLTARWVLTATRTGKLSLGPASVELEGKRYQSRPVTIEVVPQGTLPPSRFGRRPSPFQGWPDPFDPFGRMPGMPRIDDLLGNDEPPPADFPAELAVQAALDPLAFVRATATPLRVFVGQQVTLSAFAYGSRGPFQEISATEPARPDFFSIPRIEGATRGDVHRIPIGDQVWHAAKVRQVALFPLRSGDLQIGPMELGFGGGRYSNSAQGTRRSSQPLTVTVAEPPSAGRPPGYQLGDVGRFALSAEVDPREVEAGGSVSVIVTLSGVGNLPAQLRTPARTGVDFLTPTVRHTPKWEGDLYGGSKVFTYIVSLSTPGAVDLGEITLPHFNPETQGYDIARAALGTVLVKAGQASIASATAPPANTLQQLQQSLPVRTGLGNTAGLIKDNHLSDKPFAWLLLALAPLLVLVAQGSLHVIRRVNSWWTQKRSAPRALIAEQLEAASAALAQGNAGAAASALERALFLTLETQFGLKARGLLRHELADSLSLKAVPEALQQEVTACLEACDNVRFAPQGGATMAELSARSTRVIEALSNLNSARPPPTSSSATQTGAST